MKNREKTNEQTNFYAYLLKMLNKQANSFSYSGTFFGTEEVEIII